MNKDIRQLVKRAKRDGWDVAETRRGHVSFRSPDGAYTYVTSGTPSDQRALNNLRAGLRRAGLSTTRS